MQTELNAVATAKARLFWDYFAGTKQAPNFRFCCLTETIVQMICLRKNGGPERYAVYSERLVVGAVLRLGASRPQHSVYDFRWAKGCPIRV